MKKDTTTNKNSLRNLEEGAKYRFTKHDPRITGKNNPRYAGDNLTYSGIHQWIRKELGKATYCSKDQSHTSNRFEWASISREAKQDVNDYMPLCPSCHHKYDYTPERKRNTEIAQQKAQSRRAKKVTLNGQSKTLREWSEVTGLSISTMRVRRWMGQTPEEILKPSKGRNYAN